MGAPADLLAPIAGEFASDAEAGTGPPDVEREDGSWLLAGSLSADGMADRLGIRLPFERDYETTAGFALAQLRHLPETGESFNMEAGGSTSSTWTDARSTNCSRSAPRIGLRSRTRRNPLRPEGSPYRLTLLVPEAAQDHADRAADDGQFDLPARIADVVQIIAYLGGDAPRAGGIAAADLGETGDAGAHQVPVRIVGNVRSEEHTSELQSLMRISYAVFCLKKKKRTKTDKKTNIR